MEATSSCAAVARGFSSSTNASTGSSVAVGSAASMSSPRRGDAVEHVEAREAAVGDFEVALGRHWLVMHRNPG